MNCCGPWRPAWVVLQNLRKIQLLFVVSLIFQWTFGVPLAYNLLAESSRHIEENDHEKNSAFALIIKFDSDVLQVARNARNWRRKVILVRNDSGAIGFR